MNFILEGDRGVGKTSLLNYIGQFAEAGSDNPGEGFSFLVVEISMDGALKPIHLVQRLESALNHRLAEVDKGKHLLRLIWGILSRVTAFGVSLAKETVQDEDQVIDAFASRISKRVKEITGDSYRDRFGWSFDGILFLIDEFQGADASLRLGSFFKLFLERLAKQGCYTVMFGLAGLPGLDQVLSKSHPSAPRLFEKLHLGPLSEVETKEVISICIARGNRLNSQQRSITADAEDELVALSGGFPHFIHHFGFFAYAHDDDGIISRRDVIESAGKKGGALESIGERYYKDDFYNKLKLDAARDILRSLAKRDEWTKTADLEPLSKDKTVPVAQILDLLVEHQMIIKLAGETDWFKVRDRAFAMWINGFASTTITPSANNETFDHRIQELTLLGRSCIHQPTVEQARTLSVETRALWASLWSQWLREGDCLFESLAINGLLTAFDLSVQACSLVATEGVKITPQGHQLSEHIAKNVKWRFQLVQILSDTNIPASQREARIVESMKGDL